jgi:hypothetical protein
MEPARNWNTRKPPPANADFGSIAASALAQTSKHHSVIMVLSLSTEGIERQVMGNLFAARR